MNFVPQLLEQVALSADMPEEQSRVALEIGRKVGFDILARLPTNEEVAKVSDKLIELLRRKPQLVKGFLSGMLTDEDQKRALAGVLFACGDSNARIHFHARLDCSGKASMFTPGWILREVQLERPLNAESSWNAR